MNISRVNLEFSYMLLAEHYKAQETLPYVLSEMFYPFLEIKSKACCLLLAVYHTMHYDFWLKLTISFLQCTH